MKILRVLNTNSVVTIDEKKREVIITGHGIGFKKKKGECIDDTLIDKIYCLEDHDKNYTLQEIVKAISERYLEIVGKVVQAAKTEYHLKINEVLYITATFVVSGKKVVFLRIREECKCKFATSLQQMKNSDKSKRLTIHEILNSKAFFYLFSLVGSIFSNAYSHACITKREKLTFLF